MAVKITRPGMFTTFQDLGRVDYRSVGIGPGGAMDFFAASIANILVKNDEKFPVIEMHFPAAEILFEEDTLISIAGADFSGYINDKPAGLWQPHLVKKNERITFKKYINGARTYLAIRGEIGIGKWLDSFSTHTKLKTGGYKGRPFLKEDIIPLLSTVPLIPTENFPGINHLINPVYQPADKIRCIAAPEWELMNDGSKATFLNSPFTITIQSDRMGYRLQGADIALEEPFQLISSPVDYGTIQLLPNGQLIVLMADHQTTGGYPRIASVISADLPKLAQSAVHGRLQFELITIETAEEALLSLYQTLGSVKNICKDYYDAGRHQL